MQKNSEDTKIENTSPIINFEDKDYNLADLSPTSKYLTSQIADLQAKETKLKFELDQVLVAKQDMLEKFKESLKDEKLN